MHNAELLQLKDSPVSIDRLTNRTETSCEDTSHEPSPPAPPITDVTMETAQVETYSGSPDIHPRYSTPKQDIQQNGFQQSVQHDHTPPVVTPLHSIPEKAKGYLSASGCGRPEYKSRSSPMLSGTRFCSEVSDTDCIHRMHYICV